MSMTAVIENIERDAWRQVTPKNIGNIENVKLNVQHWEKTRLSWQIQRKTREI